MREGGITLPVNVAGSKMILVLLNRPASVTQRLISSTCCAVVKAGVLAALRNMFRTVRLHEDQLEDPYNHADTPSNGCISYN